MPYSIEEHKHRFASWAASRAANVNGCRFTVEQGKQILEEANMNYIAESISNLPIPKDFDNSHREWRNNVIRVAENHDLNFTHGVAAKLINIYLKSIYVCGSKHTDPKIRAIHPPIDSVLLNALYKRNIGGKKSEWQAARKTRWSKLTSTQYENVISAIRSVLPDRSGLWQIEEYWQGYQ